LVDNFLKLILGFFFLWKNEPKKAKKLVQHFPFFNQYE
jgi:hypothetical protein